jgi:hypothetical protein
MLEILFSVIIILLPFVAIAFKKIIPLFSFAVIGANPYVIAGSLLLSLLVRFQDIFKSKINKSLFAVCIIWLAYGLIIGISNFSFIFVSEYIQLIISILFLLYIYHTINTKKDLLSILKFIMLSGILLSLFEIIIFLLDLDINTKSFIGRIAENYTAFYLLISSIVIPLFFMKINKLWIFVVILGVYAIYINESRAMMLLAVLFILKEFISFNNIYFKIIITVLFATIIAYLFLTFDTSLIYDPNSIYSVLNFENNFSNLERLKLLYYSYQLFINNLFGYGLGSSYSLFFDNPVTIIKYYPHPHNTVAFLSVELGVIGVLLYIYFFTSMYRSVKKINMIIYKKLIFNIILALFLFSIVDVLFYNGVLMLIIFMLYGIVLASSKVDYND